MSSRRRFATPADSLLQDCSACIEGYTYAAKCVSVSHVQFAFSPAVPNPIRRLHIAVREGREAASSHAPEDPQGCVDHQRKQRLPGEVQEELAWHTVRPVAAQRVRAGSAHRPGEHRSGGVARERTPPITMPIAWSVVFFSPVQKGLPARITPPPQPSHSELVDGAACVAAAADGGWSERCGGGGGSLCWS
jgi:hypothetical protein